jgi:hypothetical protein
LISGKGNSNEFKYGVCIWGRGNTWFDFFDPSNSPCTPPLVGDFLTQVQKLRNPKHQEIAGDVIRDAVELFGPNFRVTHLAGLPGARIKLVLELEVAISGGILAEVVRTVSENARPLKFKHAEFEEN